MPRVSSQKIRQALLIVGEALDPSFAPEQLALYDKFGNPVTPGGISASNGVPQGGLTDQVLAKTSDLDFETGWVDPPEGGGGGTVDPTAFSTYQDLILSDEPLAYWPLAVNFDDVVGNRDLTAWGGIVPGTSALDAPFDTNSTFFDGIDDRLTTSDAAIKALIMPPKYQDVFTLELWCRSPILPPDAYPSGTNGDGPGIGAAGFTSTKEDGTAASGGGIIMGPFNPYFDKTKGGWTYATLYENVNFNEWTDPIQGVVQGDRWNHLAMIVCPENGATVQWLNGFWRIVGGALQHANQDHLFLGGYIPQRYFYGQLAHVAVYNRPLGLAELTRHASWHPGMDVVGGGGGGSAPEANVIMDETFDVLNPLWIDSNVGSDISTLVVNGAGELTTGSSSTDHDFHREDFTVVDATHHIKFMGESSGALCSLYVKWIDASHWLTVQMHRQDSAARVYYCNGNPGAPVQIGSLSYPDPANPMWIVARMSGDILTVFIYNIDPRDHPNPYSQLIINLRTAVSATIADLLGAGIEAFVGMRFTHFTTTYTSGNSRADDWIILGPDTDRYDF